MMMMSEQISVIPMRRIMVHFLTGQLFPFKFMSPPRFCGSTPLLQHTKCLEVIGLGGWCIHDTDQAV